MNPEQEIEEIQDEQLSDEQVKPVVESLLFSTTESLSVKRISRILPGIDAKKVRHILLDLKDSYDREGRGFQIVEVAGGYQMATRKQYAPYVMRLSRKKKRSPLSTAALETLAIIAYKQPIIRAEIEAIRGVDSSGVIRALQDVNLVEVVGKKEVIGRPSLYGTTEEFLKIFGLKKLSDLPSMKELKEMMRNREEELKKERKEAKSSDEEE